MLREELSRTQQETAQIRERMRIQMREHKRAPKTQEENQGAEIVPVHSNADNGGSSGADDLLRPVAECEGFSVFRDPLA
jgi:hypothetical protein